MYWGHRFKITETFEKGFILGGSYYTKTLKGYMKSMYSPLNYVVINI